MEHPPLSKSPIRHKLWRLWLFAFFGGLWAIDRLLDVFHFGLWMNALKAPYQIPVYIALILVFPTGFFVIWIAILAQRKDV